MDLTGKVALVTGAGRGLGWGISLALARAGARVCATDIDEADLARARRGIENDDRVVAGEVWTRRLDVADQSAFEHTVREVVTRWERIDVLVHCAIYMPLTRFEDLEPGDWQRQLDVGLGGFHHGLRAVWTPMVAQGGGHVLGIASGSSQRGYHEEVPYCTLKHAQEGMIKALAVEAHTPGADPAAPSVNTVGPGAPIKPTRLTWEELEALPEEEKATWADPAELGRAFVWLASQPPGRFRGLRFDAGPIVQTLDAEGDDFAFEVDKVTLYPDDFRTRLAWMESYDADA